VASWVFSPEQKLRHRPAERAQRKVVSEADGDEWQRQRHTQRKSLGDAGRRPLCQIATAGHHTEGQCPVEPGKGSNKMHMQPGHKRQHDAAHAEKCGNGRLRFRRDTGAEHLRD
jgi:hypothetical protein